MSWQAWLSIAVVSSSFVVLAFTRLPSDVVFLSGLGLLLLTGVLETGQALAGFSSSSVMTVGLLYVVVAGLQETGGLIQLSQRVLGAPTSYVRAQLRLTLPVSLLSAFLNNTPVVAMFIPTVMEWSRRIRIPASKLLIPLSYASIFGGLCTLIGTSTNLVVNDLMVSRYGGEGMGMFEIAKIGLPCAILGLLYLVLGHRLLPAHKSFEEVLENSRAYTLEMQVAAGSPFVGKTIEAAGLRNLPGAFVADLIRGDHLLTAVTPGEVLEAGDRLVFVGNVESIRTLYDQQGLRPASDQIFKLDTPRHKRTLVEAVVSNTCPLAGKSVRAGRFRQRYNAVVIAVARNGSRVEGRIGDIVLRPGDALLVESHAGFISRQKDSRDFYLVSSVEDSTPKRYEKAPVAFGILALMVLAATLGGLGMLKSAVLAAGLMLITGCCGSATARRTVEWHVLLTIAAALGLGLALETSGAAAGLAEALLSLSGDQPWMALLLVVFLTSFSTELMTNNAAAAMIFPVAMNTAEHLQVSPLPFVFSIMVAASASFATPIGYQTNLMVYGPGSYRFSDFLRIGVPLNLLLGAATVLLAPLIWPF